MSESKSKKKKKKSDSSSLYKGRLDVTRSGMGFVVVDQLEQDIMIRPSDFNTALHGDTVREKGNRSPGRGRKQGQVEDGMERKQMEYRGYVELTLSFSFFIAEPDKPMPDIYIP